MVNITALEARSLFRCGPETSAVRKNRPDLDSRRLFSLRTLRTAPHFSLHYTTESDFAWAERTLERSDEAC